MPELPEVETTVRSLRKSIVGKRIKNAFSDTPQLFENKRLLRTIGRELKGDSIASIDRHGKYLIFNLASGRVMIAHMKMTGHFLVTQTALHSKNSLSNSSLRHSLQPPVSIVYTIDTGGENVDKKREKYVRFSIEFSDGLRLLYSDVRKFGRVWLIPKAHLTDFFRKRKLAHDALSPQCHEEYLHTQLSRNRPIKALLLDQTCVAGIGNIYSDEILWAARIHPLRKGMSLKESEVGAIWQAMRAILNKGIKAGGSSIRDFRKPDGSPGHFQIQRAVYQRAGKPCRRCKSKIQRIIIAQRSTHFCLRCQKVNQS